MSPRSQRLSECDRTLKRRVASQSRLPVVLLKVHVRLRQRG